MIYPPNTTQWKVGDLVIHAADAKEPHMLMRVVGYTRQGWVKTRYNNPPLHMSKRHIHQVWINELQWLLDPKIYVHED